MTLLTKVERVVSPFKSFHDMRLGTKFIYSGELYIKIDHTAIRFRDAYITSGLSGRNVLPVEIVEIKYAEL